MGFIHFLQNFRRRRRRTIDVRVKPDIDKKVPVNTLKLKKVRNVNNDLCSICLSEHGDFYKLPCDHSFHKGCIERWYEYLKHRNRVMICPICKT